MASDTFIGATDISMRISCWNVEWHRRTSWAGEQIIERLLADDPEIVCCPESYTDFLGTGWHGIFSQPDYGYPIKPGRRKVAIWSRRPWREVDDFGSAELPSGRYVEGVTDTSLGPVQVVGVCVPWERAHVTTGNRNRAPWEDHVAYLRGFKRIQGTANSSHPVMIIGDLNQRIPRRRSSERVFDELEDALAGFDIWTQGAVPGLEYQPVCHIVGSRHFRATVRQGYRRQSLGRPLSDHDGISVAIDI
ncbi:endonuclease/exonuclease/phosphatase family protein [Shinella sp.]|uniref:endonuclease/exonuclease/phosphatase family protein n=1 Tax=Shinella sp. TaxID=1870904 RepID=UPI003F716449